MSSAPPEGPVESVPVLPLSGGLFSVQLVLSGGAVGAGDAPGGPFLALSEEDEHTRVFLGAVKGDAESVVDFCAVKLVKNSFPVAAILDAAPQTNASVEERLRTETERVRALAAAARFVPRLLQPGSAQGQSAGSLPPLLYCGSGRRLFTPPCPRCGQPLAACRDGAVLLRAKLPLWESSLERFLYCAKCVEEDADTPFYVFEPGEATAKAEAPVLSAAKLYQKLGEALAGGAETEHVRASFPCPDCVEAGARFAESVASGGRTA